jgi:hypothetical protein
MNFINPKTGRIINENSRGFKNILTEFNINNNILEPKNKSNYIFSKVNKQWYKKDSRQGKKILKNYTIDNENIIQNSNKRVKGINRFINVNNRNISKYKKLGYNYNKTSNIFERQTNQIIFYPKYNREPERQSLDDFDIPFMYTSLNNKNLGYFYIHTVDGIIEYYSYSTFTIFLKTLQNIFYRYYVTSIVFNEKSNELNWGPSYDGEINCVIKEIQKHFEENNYKTEANFNEIIKIYEDGVHKDDFEELSNIFKLNIEFNVNEYTFNFGKSFIKHKKKLVLTYKNNHVIKKETKFISIDNIQFDTEIYTNLESVYESLSNEEIESYIPNVFLKTKDTLYRNKYSDNIDLEQEQCYTPNQYYTKIFFKQNPEIKTILPNNPNLDFIKSVNHHYAFQSNIQNKGYCLDLINAYGNTEIYDDFTGFPTDLDIALSDLTQEKFIKFINENEGLASITCECIFTNKKIDITVSFPYVRFKMKTQKITIHQILMSSSKINKINWNKDLITFGDDKYKQRAFHKVLGSIESTKLNKNFCTIDPILSTFYMTSQLRNGLYSCNEKVDYIKQTYAPHISIYIHMYVNIEIEKMFMKLKNVNRIWVDGLHIDYIPEFEYNKNIWKLKEETRNLELLTEEQSYHESKPLIHYSTKYNNLLENTSDKVNILGKGGFGKSWNIKSLCDQLPNSIILLPTHILKKGYKQYKNKMTYQKFIHENFLESHKYTYIFLDEESMVNQNDFDKIIKNATNYHKIIIVGDRGQLKPIKGIQINKSDFTQIELTTNHRQESEEFNKKLDIIRDCNRNIAKNKLCELFPQRMTTDEALERNIPILTSTNDEIDRINLQGSNYSSEIKINSPIMFTKKMKDIYKNQMGIITDIDDKYYYIDIDEDEEYKLLKKYIGNIKLAYAITYHKIQGQTLNTPIVINTNFLFEKEMIYVGLSRVVNENLIYILCDN